MQSISKWARRFLGFMLVLVVIFISAQDVEALMLELSTEELSTEADVVVVGSVENKHSRWNDEGTNIYTTVEIFVDEVFEGTLDQDIIKIIVPGGEVDGITETVTNVPVFEVGQETLLFLNEIAREVSILGKSAVFYEVAGNFQGKLEVVDGTVGDVSLKSLKDDSDMLGAIKTDEEEGRIAVSSSSEDLFVYKGNSWPGDHPEIGFKLGVKGDRKEQVLEAVESWNDSSANFSILHEGELSHNNNISYNGKNEIVWYDLDRNDVLALAHVWSTGGTIIEVDMVFNESFDWGTGEHSTPGSYDVQTVALHEFGHWLGLGDHYDKNDLVMHYQYTGLKHELHEGDLAGVEYIYGLEIRTISRLAGADRYKTAIAVSQAGWPEGSNTAFISRGDDFPDSLASIPLAYSLDAPILLSRPSEIGEDTKKELQRLGVEKVLILGGPAAVSKTVEKELEKLSLSIERINGKDRYETAAKIAGKLAEFNEGGLKKAFITVGNDFPDALAVSAYAAMNEYPVLLTRGDSLPGATRNIIEELGIDHLVIIGGESVISSTVSKELEKLVSTLERIDGADCYERMLQLAKNYLPEEATEIYISTGQNFPDAMSGGVLAAKRNSGILLVPGEGKTLPGELTDFVSSRNFARTTIFGGPAAVSDDILNVLKDLLEY